MNKTRIIAELGSCHVGKWEYIKEAIDLCKLQGIDSLKLQLFPDRAPYVPTNIYLQPELFTKAFEYGREMGVPVSASVFDSYSFYFLLMHKPRFIKFSFSKKDHTSWIQETLDKGIEAIVSCDVLSEKAVPYGATKLYCIPEYPVRYEIAFDELFPRFDGFSDHTMGLRQTQRAIDAGASIIEKHITLRHSDIQCPDNQFAVQLTDLSRLRR